MEDFSIYKTLTAKQAAKYLGIGRIEDFNNLVNSGKIGFLPVGKRKKFTIEGLEAWRQKLNYHTEYTSEVVSIGRTSHSSTKQAKEYSLEKLLEEQRINKLNNMSLKKLQAYKNKHDMKHQANCLA